MTTPKERYQFNRAKERDYMPCVRAWELPDGREATMVVRTASSGICARSVVIRRGGEIVARHSVVTRPDDEVCRAARDVWKELAGMAGVKLPSMTDPIQHITMSSPPARGSM